MRRYKNAVAITDTEMRQHISVKHDDRETAATKVYRGREGEKVRSVEKTDKQERHSSKRT